MLITAASEDLYIENTAGQGISSTEYLKYLKYCVLSIHAKREDSAWFTASLKFVARAKRGENPILFIPTTFEICHIFVPVRAHPSDVAKTEIEKTEI